MLLAALQVTWPATVLVVCAEGRRAREVCEEIGAWCAAPSAPLLFPELDTLFYEHVGADPELVDQRMRCLGELALAGQTGTSRLVVTSARGIMGRTMNRGNLRGSLRRVRVGDRLDLRATVEGLLDAGFATVSVVEQAGTFARRGGILDVYSPMHDYPARIELVGDEVETLRFFDRVSQRSIGAVEDIVVVPPAEWLPAVLRQEIRRRLDPAVAEALSDGTAPPYWQEWQRIAEGMDGQVVGHYGSLACEDTLIDHLGSDCLVVVLQEDQVLATAGEAEKQALELRDLMVARGQLPDDMPVPYADASALRQAWSSRGGLLHLDWGAPTASEDESASGLNLVFSPLPGYGGRLKQFLDDCLGHLDRGRRAVVISHQADRLSELFAERGVTAPVQESLVQEPSPSSLALLKGNLSEGFGFGDPLSLLVFTDRELFGWAKTRRREVRRGAAAAAALAEVVEGDYLVHIEHGVGRYRGLELVESDGVRKEYLALEYAEGDRLLVPTEQAGRVSRYFGARGQEPSLHRLGGGDWARAKERVRKAVVEVARQLLQLYATRELKEGHAFAGDSVWQWELEASFPYVETADQAEAIRDVKRDMELPRPMDRLVCGDVGYGKTEVAIRAAFKAVSDGKQVAVLVPTTVLAQQHVRTFRERLQTFPVRTELLSRFLSEREQKDVLRDVLSGGVDICIGTHRLLQPDVGFKDLGLVVIDEEQRFGVLHKERFKQLRTEVDVLTLSATPIPRTFHMALSGVRDMSTMDTPPEERLPIKSFVAQYDEGLVREAILRELERNGQVYFVHNRVRSIDFVAQRLRELVPEASFAVGHGQMPEEHLEQVMIEFAEGRHDVLVCTTIIESGLDIANVNTLIVNRADGLGLSQLYQLRGRVGRGAARAYAYFLYDRGKRLTEYGERRLRAISEATELGAGFRIALRDLEIRGAGNLLGSEQHGHVAAVGFTLYSQLLADAVEELRGVPELKAPEVRIDLPLVAFLPADYVRENSLRLDIYRRMAAARSFQDVAEIGRELVDRFGPPPREAVNLLLALEIKLFAVSADVESVLQRQGEFVVALRRPPVDRGSLQRVWGPLARIGHKQVRVPASALADDWAIGLRDRFASMATH